MESINLYYESTFGTLNYAQVSYFYSRKKCIVEHNMTWWLWYKSSFLSYSMIASLWTHVLDVCVSAYGNAGLVPVEVSTSVLSPRPLAQCCPWGSGRSPLCQLLSHPHPAPGLPRRTHWTHPSSEGQSSKSLSSENVTQTCWSLEVVSLVRIKRL